ncbi:MAG: hypothetical protein WCK02_17440 [Bacteroidota bacterium]
MFRTKVKFDFIKLSVPAKVEFGRITASRMPASGFFTSPDITYAIIISACLTLETAYNAAQGGGKQKTAALHEAEKILDDLLRQQAEYVARIAKGNINIILSAGFNPTKQASHVKAADFTAKCGALSGEAVLKHAAIRERFACVWQYCEDSQLSEDKWIMAGGTLQAYTSIKNLKPETKYWFRVAFVIKEGQREWCKPISLFVL